MESAEKHSDPKDQKVDMPRPLDLGKRRFRAENAREREERERKDQEDLALPRRGRRGPRAGIAAARPFSGLRRVGRGCVCVGQPEPPWLEVGGRYEDLPSQ